MKPLLTALLLLLPLLSPAQLPSEALLIVNGSSPDALRVANHYTALRHIPDERILVLTPPEWFFREDTGGTRWRINRVAVDEHLLTPVLAKLDALNDPTPTALIFSPDWPIHTRLEGGTPVSLTAYIGSRGALPPEDHIKNGQARSPWFTLPEERAQGRRLLRYPAPALEKSLHPAFMLGVFHEPLDPGSIIEALTRSTAADFTAPAGSVALITNTDVRTKARLHQFAPAAERLAAKNIPVHLASAAAPLPDRLIGVLEGAASVPILQRYKGRLVPGAFAEHLTSFAATLHTPQQTKMTEWIAAGAAGTVGTVDEPLSIWTKFPLAELFERYTLGNTLLEALYQSHGHPWQSLAIGDPLCRPWAAPLPDATLTHAWNRNTLTLTLTGVRTGPGTDAHLFLDGLRLPGNGPQWTWTADPETTGPDLDITLHVRRLWAPPELHHLRTLLPTPIPQTLTLDAPKRQPADTLRLHIKSTEPLAHLELWHGNRRLHSTDAKGKTHTLDLPHTLPGKGPLRLQARAIHTNGLMSRSNHLLLNHSSP